MSVSRVAGTPDYTFSGADKNIPILFAGKCLEKFYAATMLTEIAQTDYVGEIRTKGDKVIIRTIPTVTIKDYVKNQKLDLEQPESPSVEFTVDYAKYFNFALDDIDIKQMDIAMLDVWSGDAAMQMKIAIERLVFQTIYASPDAANEGATAGKINANINLGTSGSPLLMTRTNILDLLVDMGTVLDEQNIPEVDRWCILPPWMVAMLKKSDLKDAALTGDAVSPIRNGRVGMVDRLTLYNSNLQYLSSGNTYVNFGHKSSLIFVSQLVKTEMYRPPDTFADAMKGLNVFGFKVIQPTAFGTAVVQKGV